MKNSKATLNLNLRRIRTTVRTDVNTGSTARRQQVGAGSPFPPSNSVNCGTTCGPASGATVTV